MASGEIVVQRRRETDSTAAEAPTGGEYLDPEVVKRTRETLGQFVRRPPLTDKLLNKPPFRFLHDIITAVISTTGFMNGLYSETELISDNVKERDTKIAFLQKAVDMVAMVTGRPLRMKPAKTVAGQEPEKTNEFLQALAEAIAKKMVKNKEGGESVLTGEKTKKKTVPKSKQMDSSDSASVMSDSTIGADDSKVEKKKVESDVREPANILSKQPTGDKNIPSKQPTGEKNILSKQPTGEKNIPSKQPAGEKTVLSKQLTGEKNIPSKQPTGEKKEASSVNRERRAEAKDATVAASKEKERQRVPAKKEDIAHRLGKSAGAGAVEGVKSPVRGRRPETKENRDVKREKVEIRKEKPESKPNSATAKHEVKAERHGKAAGEHLEKDRKPSPATFMHLEKDRKPSPATVVHLEKDRKPSPATVMRGSGGGAGTSGSTSGQTLRGEGAAKTRGGVEHQSRKPDGKDPHAADGGKVETGGIVGAKEMANKPEKLGKQPDAKIVNSSGENPRSQTKEKQLESQNTDMVDPQYKGGSGNGKRNDGHKFDKPVLSAADTKADSVRPPGAASTTDSHKTGGSGPTDNTKVPVPQIDKVKAIRPDTVKLNAKVREFAAEVEKPSAAATASNAPVEQHQQQQQQHLHIHTAAAAAAVSSAMKPAPHEQQSAQEFVESRSERKARKDEKQRPANPQNRQPVDLSNSDAKSEQDRKTVSEDRRKSDRYSAALTKPEMTKAEGSQMNSNKSTSERENLDKEIPAVEDTNIQKQTCSRFEPGISALTDLKLPRYSDDDDDHDDDDDDDDENDEDRFQGRGVSNVITVPGAFQDGSDDDTEHGGLVKKLLKTKKVHENASLSRKSTKVEIDRSELAFNAAKKRQQDLLMQDIVKLQSAIQSFTGNVMPLVMILEFLQEDLDSMKKEMDMWKVEIRTNTAALQQEQRLMESAVEPLQSLLSELEKEIVQQEAVNVALKSQALHNEERIRKMITSASRI